MIKKGIKVKILTGKDKNKDGDVIEIDRKNNRAKVKGINMVKKHVKTCLLYTSPSPRDRTRARMPSSA